jgi:ABC-type multidrug transport system fused ATPase/permease subunit
LASHHPPVRLSALLVGFSSHLTPVRLGLLAVILMVVASPFIGTLLLWIVKQIIDEVLIHGRVEMFPLLAAVYGGGALAKSGLDCLRGRLDAAVAERVTQSVRTDLYRHLLRLSPGSLPGRQVGDLLARLGGDASRVRRLIYSEPIAVLADAAAALFFGTFLFLLSWKLTLAALVALPPIALAVRRYAPRIRRAARVARHEASAWLSQAEESLAAAPLVHAFSAFEYETGRLARRLDAARRAEVRTVTIQTWLVLLIEAAAMVGGLVVLAVGVHAVRDGGLTLGAVVAFVGSVGSLYGPIRGLGKAPGRLHQAAAGGHRVWSLLATRSVVTDRPAAAHLSGVQGAVEFRGVSFAYPGGPPVLRKLSWAAQPGEVVALVGPNGSGKSTVVRLLLRLYDPADGSVLIDGTDIRDVTLASLREAVAVVQQDPYIVRGTIAENIRYGRPEVPDRTVVHAAQLAGAHDFIDALPEGYAAPVGPKGERLSGGQRQRLALARALLRDAPVLILDEATAGVDGEAESFIQESLTRLAGRRTVIIVAHRLSTIRRAHRILVMEGGRIVESGVPGTLLRDGTRCHGLFAGQLEAAREARQPAEVGRG